MTMADTAPTTLATLGADLRRDSWELAVEVVEEGLREESFASLAQLGRAAQLGDMATFIAELGSEIAQPAAGRLNADGPLAQVVRGHAGAREALGFGPREVATEFMLMRRVLQRYVSTYSDLAGDGLLEVEERLNDSIDRLAVECVGAYFDRATADSYLDLLVRELERARRVRAQRRRSCCSASAVPAPRASISGASHSRRCARPTSRSRSTTKRSASSCSRPTGTRPTGSCARLRDERGFSSQLGRRALPDRGG